MFFTPKNEAEIAVIQVGKGGFSYRASPFMVVNNQLPSVIISLAVIKLRASIILTDKASMLKPSMIITNNVIAKIGLF